jgi:hypothetical protein
MGDLDSHSQNAFHDPITSRSINPWLGTTMCHHGACYVRPMIGSASDPSTHSEKKQPQYDHEEHVHDQYPSNPSSDE